MRRIPAALASALLLAGCSIGPDYVKPPVETPGAYKELGDWKPAEPQEAASGTAWWSIYDDPVLDELEKQVAVSNQTLKAQEAAYRQSVALVAEARAGYFPSLGIDPSASRSKPASGQLGGGKIRNQFTLPVDASWVIDIWGQTRRQVESATATAQADAAQLAALRLSAQATLAQDYFQLRVTDEQKRLLDATAAAYARTLQITQNRYQAGVAGKSDVAQAQAQFENARAQSVALGVTRAQLEHAIAVLIGKPPAEFSLASAPFVFHAPVAPAGVPSALLERNPTVSQAERNMAAANAQIGVAFAGYFPTLTLTGSYGVTSAFLDTLLKAASITWVAGPQIAFNLFNGGLTTAQVEAARAGYDQNVATYRQAVLTAFQGVEDNLAAAKILEEQSEVQDRAVKAAGEAEQLILNQYRAGTVDFTSVITAQATALGDREAQLAILQSRLNASVLLIENLGGGWDTGQLPDGSLPVPPPGFAPEAETRESR